MVIIIIEILIFVRGLVGLFTGRITVRSGKVLTGQRARSLAWEYVLFVPVLFLFFVGLGVAAAAMDILDQSIAYASFIEFASVLGFAFYLDRKGLAKYEEQQRKRRKKKKKREIATPVFE